MENNRRILVAFLVLLGLFSSQIVESKDSPFSNCYDAQFTSCVTKTNAIFKCAVESLELALAHHNSGGQNSDSGSHYTCKSRCAMEKCTHFSTRDNPASWKVESCINSCSDHCPGGTL